MSPRVFVTSALFTGDVVTAGGGGNAIVAGDRLCADAAGDAGLSGVWRAFIALDNEGAMTRHNAGAPYRLVGTTTTVFRTSAALRAAPEVPLNRSEFGSVVAPSPVWTGTDPSGVNDGVTCAQWTSSLASQRGSVGFTNDAGGWTGAVNANCDQTARLYCFEY